MTHIVQIAPAIEPGSGVAGVAYNLERELAAAGAEVERFTATDADSILYRFTVEDPSVWTGPWSGELVLRRIVGPILEYACHEGNYGLTNILAGARVAEKAAAEAAKKSPN